MRNILLIGCGEYAGYNFVASLRLAPEKYKVIGTDINREHLELSNCDVKYLVPRNDDPAYIQTINKIIKKERIDFVHIQPDPEVGFWSRNREKIGAPLALPSKEAIEICHDKMRCNQRLKSKGVSVPESVHIKNKESIKSAFKELKKKNEKIWVRAIRGAGSRASLPVSYAKHAEIWIDYWNKMKGTAYSDFMLAEYLPGREYAFQSVWHDGELLVSQGRERKEYVFGSIMPSGQSSSPTIAVTVNNKEVNKNATDAILAVDEKPHGLYCVDLKENASGVPCITEINIGRFFTTCDFFSNAGCNMPYYFIKQGLGEKPPKLKKYDPLPPGIYWLRIIDMGKKLVREGEWTYRKI